MTQVVYHLNDNLLELLQLKDVVGDTFVNSASVDVTLVDKDGVEVPGQVWPLVMLYVTLSDGEYRATLVDTLSLIPDDLYTAIIEVDDGPGRAAHWKFPIRAETRLGI